MIEINLLPKDLQRKGISLKLDKNIVLVLSSCVALIGVMALYSFIFQAGKYATLETQLQISKAESAKYAPEITKIDEISKKKEQILARMSSIQVLDKNREYWVALMEDLSSRVPEYVWLSDVKQAIASSPAPNAAAGVQAANPGAPPVQVAASKSTIEGYSFSLNALATFLIRLKKSEMIDNVEIASIKLQEVEKANAYNFKLTCDLVSSIPVSADIQTAQANGMAQDQF
jgi:Tfp pilus assembly protein PilN